MPDWLAATGAQTWEVVLQAAPFIVFGLLVAGLLHAYLPGNFVRRVLGGRGFGPVVRAAAIGAPLPLCSCGVIPVALYLRREGASRAATQSFLISTPETSADSVALTWALMGPVMAAARLVAAVLTAAAAGALELLAGRPEPPPDEGRACSPCQLCLGRPPEARAPRQSHPARLGRALHYAFVVLMRDLAPWLVIGLGLAGAVAGIVPAGFFERHLGRGVVAMLTMLLISAPMYMCATASTPLAAAMMLKGLSPGAALVFLLAGPATNLATMTAVWRFLGRRSLALYLAAMATMSVVLGLALDALAGPAVSAGMAHRHHRELLPGWLALGSAALLLALIANGLRLRLVPYWLVWRDARRTPGGAGRGEKERGP